MSKTETTSRRFLVSRPRYSQVAAIALGALCVIVFTGALVRLTGSGLGCADWPRCSESKFVDVSSGHTAIEQINRLFTGIVSLSVIVAVLAAYRRVDRDKHLVRWAWTLVLGVVGQILLGGLVVLTGLNPYANMGHFLLSMVLVTCGFVVWRGSQQPAAQPLWRWNHDASSAVRRLVLVFVALATAVMVAGTVVTATGPHAGDEKAVRFGFELRSVVRVHSLLVISLLVCTVWLYVRVMREGVSSLTDPLRNFVVVACAQAAIGYAQYFSGVPVFLVTLHIAGIIAFWLSVCNIAVVRQAPAI